jgi:hypothetical protein
VAEGDQSGLIAGLESAKDCGAGGAKTIEAIPRDAVAHVEGEHDVQRNLLEADEVDLLEHAVVADLEVGPTETSHGTVAVGDKDVHPHGVDPARERRLLSEGRTDRSGDEEDHCRDSAGVHRDAAFRNGARNRARRSPALRPCTVR